MDWEKDGGVVYMYVVVRALASINVLERSKSTLGPVTTWMGVTVYGRVKW